MLKPTLKQPLLVFTPVSDLIKSFDIIGNSILLEGKAIVITIIKKRIVKIPPTAIRRSNLDSLHGNSSMTTGKNECGME
jgi:hypothetical protein